MFGLEFTRKSDDLKYTFHLDGTYNGKSKYIRDDKQVLLLCIENMGWVVVTTEGYQVSWPAGNNRGELSKYPPEGEWVSWKKYKSYNYELVHQ